MRDLHLRYGFEKSVLRTIWLHKAPLQVCLTLCHSIPLTHERCFFLLTVVTASLATGIEIKSYLLEIL